MSSKAKSRGLGRGLSALMTDDTTQSSETVEAAGEAGPVRTVPLTALAANPFQPRTHFDDTLIEELAASMREKGVLQPLLVRPAPSGQGYEIIAGERRWRAAQRAGVHDLPVVVQDLDDKSALELAIIENVQRQDLTPVEEARSYRRLVDEFSHNQEAVSRIVGKSRSHVANLMRLLVLPEGVLAMLEDGSLSMGHARALIGADDPESLAREVVAKGLTVRQVEKRIGGEKAKESGGKRRKAAKDADTRALEQDLAQALGLNVTVNHSGDRGGTVTINYKSLDQLDEVCGRLMASGGGN